MNGFVREVSLKNPRRANQLIKLTNKFHVAVSLFNNRSQMTWKSGKNKKVAHKLQQSVSFIFLMNTDVFHNLSLYRPMETWNQFVLNDKEARKIKISVADGNLIYILVLLWNLSNGRIWSSSLANLQCVCYLTELNNEMLPHSYVDNNMHSKLKIWQNLWRKIGLAFKTEVLCCC